MFQSSYFYQGKNGLSNLSINKFTLLFHKIPMKLSQRAKKLGISYRTTWRMYQKGQFSDAVKLPTVSIIVLENDCANKSIAGENNRVAIYCKVSDNASNLERQVERLREYAIARRYQIKHTVKEIESEVNNARPKLMKLLNQNDYKILLVEHKNRLTRFGFNPNPQEVSIFYKVA